MQSVWLPVGVLAFEKLVFAPAPAAALVLGWLVVESGDHLVGLMLWPPDLEQ